MNTSEHRRFVAHTFSSLEDLSFCPNDYSALKFGSDRVAKAFGYDMAEAFFRDHRALLATERCVVIPSAYNVVEIAATILARHFMDRLNDLLTRDGGDIVEWTTMHRTVSYLNDYADVSAEDRVRLLSQDELYIKREFIEGKTLIFVDDISITGTHERMICKFLDTLDFKRPAIFAYYAAYTGGRPGIEGDLNRTGIKLLVDLVKMTLEEDTHIMVRTLRLWLQAEPDMLVTCMIYVSTSYLDRLYHAILARGYHKVPEMRQGFEMLRDERDRRVAALRTVKQKEMCAA